MWTPPNTDYPPPKQGEPAVHRAAREGDHPALRELAAAGADLNEVFDIGLDPGAIEHPATPLMVAAGSGDGASAETVRLLLELGAKPRTVLSSGSAASYACLGLGWNYRPGGDAERLRVLIEAGTPLPTVGWAGPRLVASVAEAGDAGRLSLLLDNGLSPDSLRTQEDIEQQHRQAMEYLDTQLKWPLGGWLRKGMDRMGRVETTQGAMEFEIPVFGAAQAGSVACLELLEAAGAELKVASWSAPNALHVAGSAEVVHWLLDRELDPAAVDENGRDALGGLLEALADGEVPTASVEALVARGADLGRINEWPHTRLAAAAFQRNAPAVEFLLKQGVPVDPPDTCPTALNCVCWQGGSSDEDLDAAGERIIDLLVEAGADVNEPDYEGTTPMFDAVQGDWSYPTAVRALVRHGADPDSLDSQGRTPLMGASDPDTVRELLFAGADPTRKDRDGKTALSRARLSVGTHKVSGVSKFLLRGVISKAQLAESAENAEQNAVAVLSLLEAAAKERG